MKRVLVYFLIFFFLLGGCQSATGTNRDGANSIAGLYDALLKGSTETKTPFLPVSNEFYLSATLPGILPSIIDTPIYTQNPTPTNVLTGENQQTPEIQASNQALTSTISSLSTNQLVTLTNKDTKLPSTATPTGDYIELINITDRRIGKATVFWRMHGDTVNSFWVVYSETNPNPTYPNDKHSYGANTGSPSAESAFIYGTPGHTYYVRVCEYTGYETEDCINYSDTVQFTFNIATITPSKTISNNLIRIIKIEKIDAGVSRVYWWTEKNYPNGFEIIYTQRGSNPEYPYYPSEHANNSDRSILLYGDPGAQYYIRICGFIGKTCDDYSEIKEHTFLLSAPISTTTPSPIATVFLPTNTPIPILTNTETPIIVPTTQIPVIEETTQLPMIENTTQIPLIEETVETPAEENGE